MKKLQWTLFLVPLIFLIVSCAPPMQPAMKAFNPAASKTVGQEYQAKVDNFEIIIDTSLSMDENGKNYLVARDIVRRINEGIPSNLKYTAGLRSIGHSSYQSEGATDLLYGMADYQKLAYHNALNSIRYVGGSTPMAEAIQAAGSDLSAQAGTATLILVSDGLHMDAAPDAAKSIKGKLGDKLCIYTIAVGSANNGAGQAMLKQIADIGGCGFATSDAKLKDAGAMSSFIQKAFVTQVLDSDNDSVLNTMDKCPGTPAGVTVDSKGCPVDSDGDGVADYLDECPNTPKGAPVDKVGCPLDSDGDGVSDYLDKCPNTPKGTPVDKVGCSLDSDGDGVADYLDKCPNTPKGAPVDKVGCPLDSDGDGVADYLDKCPGTPKGVSIDADGCPTRLTLRIKFDNDSSNVAPEYKNEIAKAAQCISDYPGNQVLIFGHTDSRGASAYNQKLSERRATAVKNSLIYQFDIPADKLAIRGFGEEQPVADNNTSTGRALNRRVEVLCGATK